MVTRKPKCAPALPPCFPSVSTCGSFSDWLCCFLQFLSTKGSDVVSSHACPEWIFEQLSCSQQTAKQWPNSSGSVVVFCFLTSFAGFPCCHVHIKADKCSISWSFIKTFSNDFPFEQLLCLISARLINWPGWYLLITDISYWFYPPHSLQHSSLFTTISIYILTILKSRF